jgi:hypothetical protein
MSAGDVTNSLTELLAKSKIPVENHAIVRKLTNAIGVTGYYQRSGYIQAVRREPGLCPSCRMQLPATRAM